MKIIPDNLLNQETLDADPIDETARKVFQVPSLFPFQRYVIANILEKSNQLVIFPTGGGKSICFQLPALLLEGITVVVSPLLALLADQLRGCEEMGIPVCLLRGGQTDNERQEIYTSVSNGQIKLLYVTPEILEVKKIIEKLKDFSISHFVVDEAHCIAEWGKDFRPVYGKLGEIIAKLKIESVSAFTATASGKIKNEIENVLFADKAFSIVEDVPDRPNIHYSVLPVLSKPHELTRIAREYEKPLLIFCRSRNSTEMTARMLRQRLEDEKIFFYHAGLTKEERSKVEKWFFESDDGILTATTAYGMGVDKKNIRTIVHVDVPLSVEAYLQESGRAGRDGGASNAVLIYGNEDVLYPDKIADTVNKTRYMQLYKNIIQHKTCRRTVFAFLMNTQIPSCSGCDICEGTVITDRPGENEICSLVKYYPKRFKKTMIIDILKGQKSFRTQDEVLYHYKYYEVLNSWIKDDIRNALDIMEETGLLSCPGKGFFKFKYVPGKIIKNRK